jgi:hypothetical protein
VARRDSLLMNEKNPGVTLSSHCVERFHERFRPALDQIRARRELEMLLALGEINDEPPEWLAQKMLQEADAYLIVGNDLVLPLAEIGQRFVAKTCLDRGGISEPARKRRNERGRRRRAARRPRRGR